MAKTRIPLHEAIMWIDCCTKNFAMDDINAEEILIARDMAIEALVESEDTGYNNANEKWLDRMDKIRAEIAEEKECAYADFEQYKIDYLGVDAEYVEDELPYDDFRYGMERCIEIIDKYRKGMVEK